MTSLDAYGSPGGSAVSKERPPRTSKTSTDSGERPSQSFHLTPAERSLGRALKDCFRKTYPWLVNDRIQGNDLSKMRGNNFSFQVPIGTTTASKPIPSANTGKFRYAAPGRFLKENFELATRVPFGQKGIIESDTRRVSGIQAIRAALDCGYGHRIKWSAHLVLNPHEIEGLISYLTMRLRMAAACVEITYGEKWMPASFFATVEQAEKTCLSFILGGIGTRLAAKYWIGANGEKVKSFLHAGIIARGVGNLSALFSLNSKSEKSPDFLCESSSGLWHIFESKGGQDSGRPARLVEGLAQLARAPQVGWINSIQTPASCVCVHTSVDAGRPFKVVAVDPPGDEDTAFEGSDESTNRKPPVELIKSVCGLLLMLEAIAQFRALVEPNGQRFKEHPLWEDAGATSFRGVVVGIPRVYFHLENEVRFRLAAYLSLQDLLIVNRKFINDGAVDTVWLQNLRGDWLLGAMAGHWAGLYDLLITLQPNDILPRCAEYFELDSLFREIEKATHLEDGRPHMKTASGLRLYQRPLEDTTVRER